MTAEHMNRRHLLRRSALASGVLTLAGTGTATAAAGARHPAARTARGRIEPGAPDYLYLPFHVPEGTARITVSYTYDTPAPLAGTPGNALDIGLFDPRGTALGSPGFRGWSGGARDHFTVGTREATPGYLPGPLHPGTWHVALGPYTVSPHGMTYEVTFTPVPGTPPPPADGPRYPPERARGRGRAWYRGDLHLHTVHSDGLRTPRQVAAAARAAGLDFLATTEHNTPSAHGAWHGLWGDDLLILCGEEITTRNGHCLALGTDPGTFTDWRYRARDDLFPRFARAVHRAGGLVVPAHPSCPFTGCQWKFGYAHADAVEVWNGPWTADDELALADWDNRLLTTPAPLPAIGSSDAHREPEKVGLPQTVVLADDLSRHAILDALRAGRAYVTEHSGITLDLVAHSSRGAHAGIGERLHTPPETPVTIRLTTRGAPAGATCHLITDQGRMHSSPASDGTVEWHTTGTRSTYVRAEIRHPPTPGTPAELPGAMAAFTNPVMLGEE